MCKCVQYTFLVWPNVAADALSRIDFPVYCMQAILGAAPNLTPVPRRLVDLMVMEQQDWTSPGWAQLFKDYCMQA